MGNGKKLVILSISIWTLALIILTLMLYNLGWLNRVLMVIN